MQSVVITLGNDKPGIAQYSFECHTPERLTEILNHLYANLGDAKVRKIEVL